MTDDSRRSKRRSPALFDSIHRDRPNGSWYNPRVLAWLLVDVVLVVRAWLWHKRQSLSARRWVIEFKVAKAAQSLQFVETDEEVPAGRRQDAAEARKELLGIVDELGIEGDHVDRHRPADDEREAQP